MLEVIAPLLVKYPIIHQVILYVGITRLIVKPLMTFLGEIVVVTPSMKDNELLASILDSKIYKGVLYVFDYLGSIKIKK